MMIVTDLDVSKPVGVSRGYSRTNSVPYALFVECRGFEIPRPWTISWNRTFLRKTLWTISCYVYRNFSKVILERLPRINLDVRASGRYPSFDVLAENPINRMTQQFTISTLLDRLPRSGRLDGTDGGSRVVLPSRDVAFKKFKCNFNSFI